MSVPLDRLYNFLHDHCNHDVIIYHFFPHGSKNPNNIIPIMGYSLDPLKLYTEPLALFHDQEPLTFSDWSEISPGYKIPDCPHSRLKMKVGKFSIYDKLILVHSELNSDQVDLFEQDGAISVYYWSHAVIARDWFRYAERDCKLDVKSVQKPFLIYNRAWQGSREYRLKLADLLVINDLQQHCVTSFNSVDQDINYTNHEFVNQQFRPVTENLHSYFPQNSAPSSASADYDRLDYQSTNVEVILETLFDDTRWHLTEKTLRALAVGQPFILCATPGSLQYLRRYGFETFDQCWDESYDTIADPSQRLEAVVKLMKNHKDYDIEQARAIAQRNRQHFFSERFWQQIVTEFTTNFDRAMTEMELFRSGAYFLRQCQTSAVFKTTVSPEPYNHIQRLTGAL